MPKIHTSRRRHSFGNRNQGRARLRYELLEPRHLLAAEIGLTPSNNTHQQNVSTAPINWAETVAGVERIPLSLLASVDRTLPEGVKGPIPMAAGEWIVQLRPDAARGVRSLVQADRLLNDINNDFTIISGLGARGALLVRGDGPSRADIEASLRDNPHVQTYHLNQIIQGQTLTPNDSDFTTGQLPGLTKINAPGAWSESIGSMNIVVGVVDSGIDPTHPDLYLNIWLNQGEIPRRFLDDDGDKLVDIDGDGLITFYDLNNLKRTPEGILVASTGVLATQEQLTTATPFASGDNRHFVRDLNGNGRIDADDLLLDANWADGRDDDGNDYFDDLFGVNFRAGAGDPFTSNNPSDQLGHGTHVAGTIGAIGGNGTGVVGVNWQTSLMSLRILDNNNQGDSGAAIRAMNYALRMREQYRTASDGRIVAGANVRVLNNSWGQPGGSEPSVEAVIRQLHEAGILFVAAAGNGNILGNGVDNDGTPFYPASYDVPNVIAVAASDANDRLATFSNFGRTSVDILAPGVGIRSTVPGGGYQSANGTSMAAPHVAGNAALIWSALPEATVDEVKQAILSSTTGIAQTNIVSTGGRLNAANAIKAEVFAPSARLQAAENITTPGGTTARFTVEYFHRSGFDQAAIEQTELLITRQWGQRVQLSPRLEPGSVSITGSTARANYIIDAPGGTWDILDYGAYTIRTVSATTKSKDGTAIPNLAIGSIFVKISESEDPSVKYVQSATTAHGASASLKAAVKVANESPTPITIILERGTYSIDSEEILPENMTPIELSGCEIGNESYKTALLEIRGDITIVGDNFNETIIMPTADGRIFSVAEGGRLNLQRIQLTAGRGKGMGGAILSAGTLVLESVFINNSVATGGTALSPSRGGAIAIVDGIASITNSWIDENVADFGGALFLCENANANISNTTMSRNLGGGVHSHASTGGSIENSTFSGNSGGLGAIFSGANDGLQGGGGTEAAISPDGRYVAFTSRDSSFVHGDNNFLDDIYLFDRETEKFELISKATDGQAANGHSRSAAISRDGNILVYTSHASNLGDNDNGFFQDVYAFNRVTNTTKKISVGEFGQPGNFFSEHPQISSDGNFAVFTSNSSNLSESDTNGFGPSVFLYSFNTGTSAHIAPGRFPVVDERGDYIAFTSSFAILSNDINNRDDVYLYEKETASLIRLVDGHVQLGQDHGSHSPSISGDGNYVAFVTRSRLASNDTNDKEDIYLFDRTTATIRLISVVSGMSTEDRASFSPSINFDGSLIAFYSDASFGNPGPFGHDIFVYARDTDSITRISSRAIESLAGSSRSPKISDSGDAIVFQSDVNFLVHGDNDNAVDIFLFDSDSEAIIPVSHRKHASLSYLDVNHATITETRSASAAVNGFVNIQNSLIAGNDVSVELDQRSVSSHSVLLSSVDGATLITPLQQPVEYLPPIHGLKLGNPAINGAAGSGTNRDQLGNVRDEQPDIGAVETLRGSIKGSIMHEADAENAFDFPIFEIVAEGSFATYRSLTNNRGDFQFDNIPPGNYSLSAILPDFWGLVENRLAVVSPADTVMRGREHEVVLGGDGNFIVMSTASSFSSEDVDSLRDIYIVDRKRNSSVLVSRNRGASVGDNIFPSISDDSNKVVFLSYESLLPEDNNNVPDVYLYDRLQGRLTVVSQDFLGRSGAKDRFRPTISGDGRFIVFASFVPFGDVSGDLQ
ncbi:MAG TPA: hypothetical protein DDZ51_06465, partial [Planctomycetaceae bacterium]|nr:hypothetical protein [Planctomycetaceae bacterium]